MTIRVGIDTGGTFTDVILYDDETGEIHTTKTPSTPPNFDRGVLSRLDTILERHGYAGEQVGFLSHGTTVGTNAVIEEEIPTLGLITNAGLRDILEIGDQTRPALYDFYVDDTPSLIPRRFRKGVPGRMGAAGNEIEPLDEQAVRAAVTDLRDAGVDSIVVAMLFSYLNDAHERAVGSLVEEHAPGLEYALSSQVHPEIREYERTITTVLNQGIKSMVSSYFERLGEGMAERDVCAPLNIMHSGGGLFTRAEAARNAIRTVLSGPAAGAVATRDVCASEGFEHAIGMDMGGTSADVSLIRDNEIVRTTELEINDLPIQSPMIDITTVGAGGGSITWIDAGGSLRVGPKSAGADPGPVCYGRGGLEPTVTDANVLLGRIDPHAFLEGEHPAPVDRVRALFDETIATPLEQSVEAAAQSVINVANASLARAIRRVTVERGTDPADFALVAFGGAGPLQAVAVGEVMNIETIVIPPSPGVFSARGLLIADVRIDESKSFPRGDVAPERLDDEFGSLESTVGNRLSDQGFDHAELTICRQIDLRYVGQSYELTIPVPSGAFTQATLTETERRFHAEHERLYGHGLSDEPTEIVTLRVSGSVTTPRLDANRRAARDRDVTEQSVYFAKDGFISTTVLNRDALGLGESIDTPAIITEHGSTTLLPPQSTARIGENGSIVIQI